MANKRRMNIITPFSFLTFLSFSLSKYGAEKDIIDGDITESYKNSTVIAKAPKDLNFKSLDSDNNGKISLQEAIKEMNLAEKIILT